MEFVGGQAVIEGVLMKGGENIAIAVRNPSGEIQIKTETSKSITKKYKILSLPLLRGPIILAETTIMGIKALNYSANISIQEEDSVEEEKLGTISIVFTMLFSLALALFLFKFIPLSVAQLGLTFIPAFENRFLFNLTEGVVKIGILVGYIYVISLMPDVKRVFQYHGAEHKTVNAWENNDVENAHKYSRIHIRCGTSFILFVLSLSIIVYLFLPTDVSLLSKYALRLALLPIIAGFGYELIKMSPKYEKNALFKIIMAPGLWLQKLTTKEPTEDQLEVAKAALSAVTDKPMIL
jgi:uncharacterized protein YqhQ